MNHRLGPFVHIVLLSLLPLSVTGLADRYSPRLTLDTILAPDIRCAIESQAAASNLLVGEVFAAGYITPDLALKFLFLVLTSSTGSSIRCSTLLSSLGLESHESGRDYQRLEGCLVPFDIEGTSYLCNGRPSVWANTY